MTKMQDMRKLVDLHASCFTDQEIADKLDDRDLIWVREVRTFLELEERFPIPSRRPVEVSVQFKSMESPRSKPKSEREAKRKCLMCQGQFLSNGPQNRICGSCAKHEIYHVNDQYVGAR